MPDPRGHDFGESTVHFSVRFVVGKYEVLEPLGLDFVETEQLGQLEKGLILF